MQRPSPLRSSWLGLNKYQHSAEIFRCVDALAAICGQIGVPGGGGHPRFATQRISTNPLKAIIWRPITDLFPEPLLGRSLLEFDAPKVRMMFVNGGNPVNQSPNSNLVARAFDKLEFIVIVDTFLNDTADYADVFLPTTMFLEEEDILVSWGHNIIGGVNPVIEPVGRSRSDLWICQQLASVGCRRTDRPAPPANGSSEFSHQ